jgi:cyclopropane fatty-acyl-phospholipid synthase-like methyltransferase
VSASLEQQADYWNREAPRFHSIYSHDKAAPLNFLDRVFRQDMYERYLFTLQHAQPIEGRTFLDVGCGSGVYSVELAKRGAARVVGLDIADRMLAMSTASAAREGVADRCRFVRSDLLQFEGGERFDVTIGIGLFDYIADPLPVLRKMREVSTDRVIVSFPRLWTWRAPVRKVRLTLRGCPVYFFSAAQVRRLMAEAGFARTEITRVGKLHCVVGIV